MTASRTPGHPGVGEVDDRVFGRHRIREPLLRDLLGSEAVSRLQGVHQGGAAYLVRPGRSASRHDHAVGVMLLIRRLGGSVLEQAAGLIHDVSHTAFSHVIDQVFDNRDETHHEENFIGWVRQTDIPSIARCHGVNLDELADVERWPLLEQPTPELCADRIDYTLRDLLDIGWITNADIEDFLAEIAVHDAKIVTTTIRAALWFAEQFFRVVTEVFMDPVEMYAHHRLAEAIRIALDRGMIKPLDLRDRDEMLLDKLRRAQDDHINRLLAHLTPDLTVVEDPVEWEMHVFAKGRYVDPLVLLASGETVRSSTLQPSITGLHEAVLSKARQGSYLRRLPSPQRDFETNRSGRAGDR